MVYLVIDNLLSTSKNRPLIEALWFMAVSRSQKPENSKSYFENVSIGSICEELKAQINHEGCDVRRFLFSTQLTFGILKVYKIQIDKLYDQSRLIVQTWNSSQFNENWLSQLSQKRIPQEKKVSQTRESKSVTKNQSKKKHALIKMSLEKIPKNSKKENSISQNLIDDLELMEDIFKIPDSNNDSEDEDMPDYLTSTNKKVRNNDLIDQTTAIRNITIFEASEVAATSGYQTLVQFGDDEDFGEASSNDFQNLLKDSETEIYACHPMNRMIDETNVSHPFEYPSIDHIKRRRLTFSNFVDDMHRNINNSQMDSEVFDVYEMPPQKDFSSFKENLNEIEISEMIKPPVLGEDQSLPENSHEIHLPELVEPSNLTIPEISNIVPEVESELVLEKIDKAHGNEKRKKKARNLIIDKQSTLNDSAIYKNFETYKDKFTELPPFEIFETNMSYHKHCSEAIFTSPSPRLKNANGKLKQIYVRNMKSIPERLLNAQKRVKDLEDEKETEECNIDLENVSTPKKKSRILRSQNGILKDKNLRVKELNDNKETFTQIPFPSKNPMDIQGTFEMDVDLPSIIVNDAQKETSLIEANYSPPEKKRRTNIKQQQQHQLNKSSPQETEGSEHDKQMVLSKLKKLWATPNEPITMNKICAGHNRCEAAKMFFELLVLSKNGVVELSQNGESLEIANIYCKDPNNIY